LTDPSNTPRSLIGQTLRDLASDTAHLLLAAEALEGEAAGISNHADRQALRVVAVLVKSAALQVGMAAANVVGTASCLLILAELDDASDADGELPS
jgi:hypothetical protein